MKAKTTPKSPDLFRSRLDQMIDMKHPLCALALKLDWERLDNELSGYYSPDWGAPAKPTRLMVALHYLKHAFDESDEGVVYRFVENPYWQYFCGFEYFQHRFPIDPSSMTRWRSRIGEDGVEKLLASLISLAKQSCALNQADVKRVVMDTTVQEKAIAHPTDARLLQKARQLLVQAAKKRGIKLRQSYEITGKKALVKHGRFAHAKQYKKARKVQRKLKTYLGRVIRDIERKAPVIDEALATQLSLSKRILSRQKDDKNKLYSLHAPEVVCIAKGKARKRYEFGSKVSVVTTAKSNWVVGIRSLDGNPYDGHTLDESLKQVERITDITPEQALVDRGFRGHGYAGDCQITIVNERLFKKASYWLKKQFRRRSAIEPVIGHLKQEHRMSRNYLKGSEGDKINALLCGCGFNFRKLLRAFLRQIWGWYFKQILVIFRPEQPQTSFSL